MVLRLPRTCVARARLTPGEVSPGANLTRLERRCHSTGTPRWVGTGGGRGGESFSAADVRSPAIQFLLEAGLGSHLNALRALQSSRTLS